jgi:polyhydroxybutyrate depolymerase
VRGPATGEDGEVIEEPLHLTVGDRERGGTIVHADTVAPGSPVLLLLHGSNQSVRLFRRAAGALFDPLAERGVVLAYLEGYRHAWNDARLSTDFAATRENVDDVGYAGATIDYLRARFAIDPARVFAFGFSNGGQLILRLLHEIPERIAGAAWAGATQPTADNFRDYPAAPVPRPVLMFHGTADPIVPFEGGMASLRGLRPRGMGRSAAETAAYYAARNGITAAPVTRRIDDGTAGLPIDVTEYREEGRPPVVLYAVEGGGHTVPGQSGATFFTGKAAPNLDAAAVAAEFFGL